MTENEKDNLIISLRIENAKYRAALISIAFHALYLEEPPVKSNEMALRDIAEKALKS